MASAIPRERTASSTPKSAHRLRRSQPAANPLTKSKAEGQLMAAPSLAAMMTLASAPVTKTETAKTDRVMISATTFDRTAAARFERCMKVVLNVFQPNSLPNCSTPRINANMPK